MTLRHTFSLQHAHGQIEGVALEDDTVAPEGLLLPAEEAAVQSAGPRRRASFVAGRTALRAALHSIGAPTISILNDDRGQPILPSGYSGSISHKVRDVVAIARQGREHVGIDVEHRGPSRLRIADKVLTARELQDLAKFDDEDRWLALVVRFSAKEAMYKAIHPTVRRYVDFLEAEVDLDGFCSGLRHAAGEFATARARLFLKSQELIELEVTWHLGEFVITTALARS